MQFNFEFEISRSYECCNLDFCRSGPSEPKDGTECFAPLERLCEFCFQFNHYNRTMCCYCPVCGEVQYYFLELNSWNLLTFIYCAASKSKARSEGPSRPAGPERSGVFALRSCAAKHLETMPADSGEHPKLQKTQNFEHP